MTNLFQAEIRFPARLRELFVELLQTGADALASEYYLSAHQEELLDYINNYLSKEKRQIRLARKSGNEILSSRLTAEEGIKVTRDARLGLKVVAAARKFNEAGLEWDAVGLLRDWAAASINHPDFEPEKQFTLALADALEETMEQGGKAIGGDEQAKAIRYPASQRGHIQRSDYPPTARRIIE